MSIVPEISSQIDRQTDTHTQTHTHRQTHTQKRSSQYFATASMGKVINIKIKINSIRLTTEDQNIQWHKTDKTKFNWSSVLLTFRQLGTVTTQIVDRITGRASQSVY